MSIKKSYDFMDRPLEITLPDNSKILYDHDSLFCRHVKRLSSSGEEIYTHTYEDYDLSGNLITEDLIKNTGKIKYVTDLKNRLTRIDGKYFQQECHYDDADNFLRSITDHQESTYVYDSLNQVQSENYPDQSRSYVHDSTQNRIKEGQIDKIYNDLDELEKFSSESYVYDLNGNLHQKCLSSEVIDYRYDALNRLVEIKDEHKKIVFTYDPLGRKLIKNKSQLVNGKWEQVSRIKYLYDGSNDIGSMDNEGNIQELRVRGYSIPFSRAVAIELNKNTYVPIHDNQGTIKRLIDPNNLEFATKHDFSMFGEYLCKEGLFNPWGYSGKRLDPDLNLVDFGKRFYSPSMGRWLTTDPGDFIDGFNLYAYAHNNPHRYTDPNGLFALPLIFLPLLEISFAGAVSWISAEAVLGVIAGVAIGVGIYQIDQVWNDEAAAVEEEVKTENKKKKAGAKIKVIDIYAPNKPLPATEDGVQCPDVDVPHTQLEIRKGRRCKYPQAREYGYDGKLIKNIDFTDHGRPEIHPCPHQHRWHENLTGGSKSRGSEAELVEHWMY